MAVNKQFFEKKSVLILSALVCTALWGSAFPCVKAGYQIRRRRQPDDLCRMAVYPCRSYGAAGSTFYGKERHPKGDRVEKSPQDCFARCGPDSAAVCILLYFHGARHRREGCDPQRILCLCLCIDGKDLL